MFRSCPVVCDCGVVMESDETYFDVGYMTCPRCFRKINLIATKIGFGDITLARAKYQCELVNKRIIGRIFT